MIADRRLWLTADRARVVEEGDPEAAFLFTSPGKEISDEDAERYGLDEKPKAEEKQAETPADKEAPAPANKARKATKKKS